MKGKNQTLNLPPRVDQIGRASVFVAVARTASFSGAAEALGMARSTVSEQIRQLEEALGVRLLERTTRSVRLTDEGTMLLEHMEVVHAAWGDAQDAFDARRREPRGHLRITAPAGFATSVVGPALSATLQQHARVTAELIVDDVIRDLVAEGIDVAIRAAPLDDSRLIARRLGSMPLRLVGAATWASVLDGETSELESAPWVGHRALSGTEIHVRARAGGDTHSLRVHNRATATSSEGQIALLLGAVGIASMPWPLIADAVEAGRLITSARWLGGSLPLYAIYPARRLLPARTRALLDEIAARLPGLVEEEPSTQK